MIERLSPQRRGKPSILLSRAFRCLFARFGRDTVNVIRRRRDGSKLGLRDSIAELVKESRRIK